MTALSDCPYRRPGPTRAARVAARDGVRLACHASGPKHAPPIVFVHGYPDDHVVWDPVVARLETGFRCVRYDVRGAGRSDKPRAVRCYSLDRLAADLETVIDWASPDEPVHLIAHDWGSIQSWAAVTDPALSHRIAGFTSISGPCLDHVGHWLHTHARHAPAALAGQLAKSWYIAAFHLPVLGSLAWRAVLGRAWPRVLANLEGMRLPVTAGIAEDGRIGMRLYRANIGPRLARPVPRHACCPVQLIVPERDPFVGRDLAELARAWTHDLRVVALDAGHWAPLSASDSVADHCRDFIRALSGARPGGPTPPNHAHRASA